MAKEKINNNHKPPGQVVVAGSEKMGPQEKVRQGGPIDALRGVLKLSADAPDLAVLWEAHDRLAQLPETPVSVFPHE